MPTEKESHQDGDVEQSPTPHSADNNIVEAGNEDTESESRRSEMPVVFEQIINALFMLNNPARSTMGNLSPEERAEVIRQRGRKSDQDNSFRNLVLIAGSFVFCFALSAVVGLITFMVTQGVTAYVGEILSGVGGLIAGLLGGIGGTLAFVSRRH